MSEKVFEDLESEKGPVESRSPQPFHTFMFNTVLMQYGMPQITIKVLMQLSNGLKIANKERYSCLLNRCLGLVIPPLRIDEVQIIIRSHAFF